MALVEGRQPSPAAVHGNGRIAFNGTSGGGTSKLVNSLDTTNVLGGSNTMTICAWIYAANSGEGGNGCVVALDHTAGGVWLQHDSGSTPSFKANTRRQRSDGD